MMELFQLKVFHLVAEYKSFSLASQKVFRSQSAVSHQIKSLEDELETKLFRRVGGSRMVELTPDGILFKEITKALYLESISVVEKFLSKKQYSESIVKVACSPAITSYIVSDILEKIASIYPKIILQVSNPPFEKYFTLLRIGEVDFCMGHLDVVPPDIIYHEFYRAEWYLITNSKHPLADKKNIELEEIVKYPFVMPPARNSLSRTRFDDHIRSKNLKYSVAAELSDNPNDIKKFVKMGMITFVTRGWLKNNDITDIAVMDVTHLFSYYTVGVIFRKDKKFSFQAKMILKSFDPDLDLNNILNAEHQN